ncbi:MAG TPA: ABA4-like family protein, partial [Cyclobacteriaceae bacterium]|nr:ABA4-like family protein [Cyclobacteriaceae bacterium]
MSAEKIFSFCNMATPVGWLMMIVAPRWIVTRKLVLSGIYPLLLGLVYLTLIVVYFGDSEGDFGSLQGVAKLFENPFALTAGWIHYLAFDMFIGAWEINDSQKHGINHFLV